MPEEKVLIVPHTHWDREWYLPFEGYRQWLVGVVDRVLDMMERGELEKFSLDGQSVVAEDYLEIRPERENEFTSMVKAGKLKIGPWYTQPDEWIPSGEALVRNLLYGIRAAKKYGGSSMVGYLPDTFGHVATLPSILNGFGISTFIFSRGVGDEGEGRKDEFIWKSPDGSSVLAVHLRYGYCNAVRLGLSGPSYSPHYISTPSNRAFALEAYYGSSFDQEAAIKKIAWLIDNLRKNSAFKTYAFFNGCDHQPAQDLREVLKLAEEKFPGVQFSVGDLDEYVGNLRALPELQEYSGELRGARFNYLLSGVLSTRADVKQLNFEAENTLESYAEPLSAFAKAFGGNPRSLAYAWKLILKSHAHDSIYSSGVDEVNEQVAERLTRAREVAMGSAQFAFDFISSRITPMEGETLILVFNPTNSSRSDFVRVYLPHLKKGIYKASSGAEESGVLTEEVSNTEGLSAKDVAFEFLAKDVPAIGYKEYAISTSSSPSIKSESGTRVENEYYAVSLGPDGSLTLLDKSSNRS
ncbi:MAG: hypothetical protein ACP5TI_05595, partial [Thermoprotei archaeon]